MHRAIAVLLMLGCGDAAAQAGKTKVPQAATRLVAAVHGAAASGAPETLRKSMSPDFVSSFGGDGGPDEAIALWTREPAYLRHLAQSTAGHCQRLATDYVECPPHAGSNYRAGFKLIDGKWTFSSFVASD
ncbi:hypothetical protein JR064_19060 [Xanthomonas sp. CFBP 8703]|uniref:Uncharacterized protein n=1 Tax=Xanthomonas bonasiae TaxID=2810351 RepID=A0ABS3B7M0_9XANT|nr:hypothetical protein [Xanthomonas bonasiae]MBN6104267.1 hypothetical protein [Xanthomonas bonasiae]